MFPSASVLSLSLFQSKAHDYLQNIYKMAQKVIFLIKLI